MMSTKKVLFVVAMFLFVAAATLSAQPPAGWYVGQNAFALTTKVVGGDVLVSGVLLVPPCLGADEEWIVVERLDNDGVWRPAPGQPGQVARVGFLKNTNHPVLGALVAKRDAVWFRALEPGQYRVMSGTIVAGGGWWQKYGETCIVGTRQWPQGHYEVAYFTIDGETGLTAALGDNSHIVATATTGNKLFVVAHAPHDTRLIVYQHIGTDFVRTNLDRTVQTFGPTTVEIPRTGFLKNLPVYIYVLDLLSGVSTTTELNLEEGK